MNALRVSRNWLSLGAGMVVLVAVGVIVGKGVSAIVNAHGGDTSKFHACVNQNNGLLLMVGPNNGCGVLPPQWQNPIHWAQEGGDDDWSGVDTGSLYVTNPGDKFGIGMANPQVWRDRRGHSLCSPRPGSRPLLSFSRRLVQEGTRVLYRLLLTRQIPSV